ncbi:dephospho-CoA kinase [Undibacterium sp. Ji42W]|uniref:dephospho-CoA kinase n=1 Tax=Undibacterium sp. Ji42W TaxID=3413039 RepID=UPI003BF14958
MQTMVNSGGKYLVRPAVVLLTGGMGTGKTSVASQFTSLGVPVLDADLVARQIHQDPEHVATKQIAQELPQIVDESGRVKRGILRTLLVADVQLNEKLKAILQPHVMVAMQEWTAQQRAVYVVWESALFPSLRFASESGCMAPTRILLVEASEATRLQRLQQRNPGWAEAEFRQVFQIQASSGLYLQCAHEVMSNENDIASLCQQVLHQHLIYMSYWSPL